MELTTTFTYIICVLLICKYFKGQGFSTVGTILFLSGFAGLVLLQSIGGFLEAGGDGHKAMLNIGNILGAGLLIASLFIEMLASGSSSSADQSAGGPPPPQF